MADTYELLGVSSDKQDVHAAIARQDKGLFPGAFCKITPDTLTGDPAYCLVSHADGVGTKSTVAYLQYQETGDPDVFRGLAQDSLAMNTDDMACVGVTGGFVVSNTIGRNARRIGRDAITSLVEGHEDFAVRMGQFGINLTLAGGETADIGDLTGTLVVDSTLTARLRRDDVVDASGIRPGDVIVGFGSAGQATYEDTPNSGIGSNGLTLARHTLLHHDYIQYPETVSSTLEPSLAYTGPYHLSDILPDSDQTVAEALLSPTRTYLPLIRAALQQARGGISGIIHCSGGGQVKCKNFGSNLHYIKNNLFMPPPIFTAIEEAGRIPRGEMYHTLNMGHRLEMYCKPGPAADTLASIAKGLGIEARVIGEVTEHAGGNKVTIQDQDGTYTYE